MRTYCAPVPHRELLHDEQEDIVGQPDECFSRAAFRLRQGTYHRVLAQAGSVRRHAGICGRRTGTELAELNLTPVRDRCGPGLQLCTYDEPLHGRLAVHECIHMPSIYKHMCHMPPAQTTTLHASCNALAVEVLGVRRMCSNALHVLRAYGTVRLTITVLPCMSSHAKPYFQAGRCAALVNYSSEQFGK